MTLGKTKQELTIFRLTRERSLVQSQHRPPLALSDVDREFTTVSGIADRLVLRAVNLLRQPDHSIPEPRLDPPP